MSAFTKQQPPRVHINKGMSGKVDLSFDSWFVAKQEAKNHEISAGWHGHVVKGTSRDSFCK